MNYSVIFSSGNVDDYESEMKGYRSDILIRDSEDNYFEVNFFTTEVLNNAFSDNKVCYLETNLVILQRVTKENILLSIKELDKWLFYKRWKPLSNDQLRQYYYPKEDWKIVNIEV